MIRVTTAGIAFVLLLTAQAAHAGDLDPLSRMETYLSKTAEKVKATDDPAKKRAILNESFQSVSEALARIDGVPGLSEENRTAIARLRKDLQEKHEQLNGLNGRKRTPDAELNNLADTAQQSFALENRTITISLTTALLILIILILLL